MTRRKGEISAKMNERDAPHIVELALPEGGFGTRLNDVDAFHRLRGIESRRGAPAAARRRFQPFLRAIF
jgi:hypothetical protein